MELERRTPPEDDAAEGWRRAGYLAHHRYERLIVVAWGTTIGMLVAALGMAILPGALTVAVAGVFAALAVGAWVAAAQADAGPRKVLREAYSRWLYAEARVAAFREAARAYVEAGRALRDAGDLAKLDDEVKALWRARSEVGALDDPRLREVEKALDEEVRQVVLALQAQRIALEATLRAEMSRVEAGVEALRAATAHQASSTAALGAEPTALVYPTPGQVPSSPVGVEAMRREVADAEQRAEDGRVYESHAAGVILNEPTRWAGHAVPFKLTQELMELFDPASGDGSPAPKK